MVMCYIKGSIWVKIVKEGVKLDIWTISRGQNDHMRSKKGQYGPNWSKGVKLDI